MATRNRSLELSELVWFQHKYLAMCDVSGVVYKLRPHDGDIFPRFVLADGDGKTTKTFKTEWAARYKNDLIMGSHGKEWIQDGVLQDRGAEWIKRLDPDGRIRSLNWGSYYERLRRETNTTSPGYLTHEAVDWNEDLQEWIFLPRKAVFRAQTSTTFADSSDEHAGSNLIIYANEDFSEIRTGTVGPLETQWGFSSMAAIPQSELVLAIKVKELGDITESKLTVFNITDQSIHISEDISDSELNANGTGGFVSAGNVKFEGVEFLLPYETVENVSKNLKREDTHRVITQMVLWIIGLFGVLGLLIVF